VEGTNMLNESFNAGKILVLGSCALTSRVIQKMLKVYGMKKVDFDFIPYNKVTHFDFGQLLKTNRYIDIFIGAAPHSAKNTKGSTSPAQFLIDYHKELPKVQELRQLNGEFGISKENFQNALLHSDKYSAETRWEFKMGLLA
jgi:hypothetical protein